MNLPDESRPFDLKIPLRFDVPLSRFSTFQIGGPARFFSEPTTMDELRTLLEFASDQELEVLTIGKGSNVLFPDEGFPGLVITTIHFEHDKIICDPHEETVTASSGVNLYRLALACRDGRLGGTEFLSHIPGTLGGALIMNAGFSRFPGKKMEIGNLVEEVTVLGPDGEERILKREDLEFSYRKSNLDGFMILGAKLKLFRAKPEDIQAEIQASFDYRNRVQDLRYPSAGSVFKNPSPPPSPLGGEGRVRGESSGQMIEKVGLKGKRIGGAMISDRHGNFIVNLGGAKASDVVELIQTAREKVFEAFGIHLEPEIRIIEGPLVQLPS